MHRNSPSPPMASLRHMSGYNDGSQRGQGQSATSARSSSTFSASKRRHPSRVIGIYIYMNCAWSGRCGAGGSENARTHAARLIGTDGLDWTQIVYRVGTYLCSARVFCGVHRANVRALQKRYYIVGRTRQNTVTYTQHEPEPLSNTH